MLGDNEKAGDAQALAAQNIGLAHIIAHRFHASMPELDCEDLTSEATRALVKAAETFDLRKSQFTTYAARVIENRLCDVYDKQKRYRKIFEPSIEEQTAAQGDAYESPQDLIPSLGFDPARQAHRNEMTRNIAEMVKGLEGRQKAVIEGIMNGESYQTIADRLGVSKQAVEQMAKRTYPSIRERLEDDFGNRPMFMPYTEPIKRTPQPLILPSRPPSKPILATLWRKIAHLFGGK